MDTSHDYIYMCQLATKIQEMWKKKDKDFIYTSDDIVIWLPRQDQIQELMYSPYYGRTILIDDFFEFAYEWWDHFSTMDQLWLAYAMHEMFSKIWDGEKWVNKYAPVG